MAKKTKLYIIHGWTYTTTPWTRTISLLEKQGIKVEMLHVPGLTSPSKKVWTIEEYVKWADRNIPDDSVALGHSNGGRILLNLCVKKPEKLQHLILLDSAGVYELSSKRDVIRSLSKKFSFLKHIPGLTKVWHKLTRTTDYARAPENMKQTLANMLESDKDLDLTKVTTPTSILWGEADTVTPPHQGEKMHAEIIGSTLTMYPHWTHAPYLSHPDELAKAIIGALAEPIEPRDSKLSDTTAKSASLALKRAPKPTLEAKEQNSVAPDVPTKLVLRKNDSNPTAGMIISEAESTAVKYRPKKLRRFIKATDAAKDSASYNLKKAIKPKSHSTGPTTASASASFKKSQKVVDDDTRQRSASLALKKNVVDKTPSEAGLIAELDQKSEETVDFVPAELKIISTATVKELKASKKQRNKRSKR